MSVLVVTMLLLAFGRPGQLAPDRASLLAPQEGSGNTGTLPERYLTVILPDVSRLALPFRICP